MLRKSILGLALAMNVIAAARAQTIPVGTLLREDSIRYHQVRDGAMQSGSFMIRPLAGGYANGRDSMGKAGGKFTFMPMPLQLRMQYNSHHPYGWNDGSMIPARGYQQQLSAGIYARYGILSIQLQPEWVLAQNSNFAGFPVAHTDSIWRAYYDVLNRIDNPEKFGNGVYSKLFPGQSSIRLTYKKFSLALSTENLWWGPGRRNSLIMSNTAPGFPHLSFSSSAPVKTIIGNLEWQLIAGKLKESGILPPDTGRSFEGQPLYISKNRHDRYINAAILVWEPKWIKGLFLGFSRSFYQYDNNIPHNLNGYLPVVGALFKGNSVDESEFGRDQLLSFFFRWVLPKEKAELYMEYGRNDHSGNPRDFLLEPEHSRAYLIGLTKLFPTTKGRDIQFLMEFTTLQAPATGQVRDIPTWYQHHQIRHGYTQLGQVLGAGIGPGSNSQTIEISWLKGIRRFGLSFERVVRNNDFYYQAFAPMRNYQSHWVDLSLNLDKSFLFGRWQIITGLSLVRSLNYQWRYKENPASLLDGKTDVTNIHLYSTLAYRF